MDNGLTTMIFRESILQVALLSAPVLLTALVVGLVISIIQATTSIQEQTLTFVPKITAILLILLVLGGWMLSELSQYTNRLFSIISEIR